MCTPAPVLKTRKRYVKETITAIRTRVANVTAKMHQRLRNRTSSEAPWTNLSVLRAICSGADCLQRLPLKGESVTDPQLLCGVGTFMSPAFLARYHSAIQARFRSPDPVFIAIERLRNPQGLNLYNYTLGNPLRYTDPTGMQVFMKCETTEQCQAIVDQLNSRDNAGFQVELKNGEIKVVGGADKVDTSKLSDAEKQLLGAITDPKNIVQLTVRPTSDKLDQRNHRSNGC